MGLKIVFMGTPDFAVKSLSAIIGSVHQVVAVVTSPDKPAGRGKQLRTSAIKQYAQANNLSILQPANLKDETFVETLKNLKADLFIVVAFRMLPKVVWSIPPKGTFNLHASLLPNYRGAAPINWAIIKNEKTTGVSTFLIDEAIDTGQILLQQEYPLSMGETAGSLHDKLADLGSKLIIETVNAIENGITPIPQRLTGKENAAPKLNQSNTRIDWDQSLAAIDAFVRGLSPYPSAWTEIHEENKITRLKIFRVEIEAIKHTFPPHQLVVDKQQFLITHPEGFIHLMEVQLPNKRRMRVHDLRNGWQCSPQAKVK